MYRCLPPALSHGSKVRGGMGTSSMLETAARLIGVALLPAGSPLLADDIEGQIVAFRPAERVLQVVFLPVIQRYRRTRGSVVMC